MIGLKIATFLGLNSARGPAVVAVPATEEEEDGSLVAVVRETMLVEGIDPNRASVVLSLRPNSQFEIIGEEPGLLIVRTEDGIRFRVPRKMVDIISDSM